MAQQQINLGTPPTGTDGDTIRTALSKCASNFADLDSRVTTATSTANAALPMVGGSMMGPIINRLNTYTNIGMQMTNPSGGGIGGSWADWVNRGAAIQLDCLNPQAAYQIVRASHWGSRHLASIDAYEGGSLTSQPRLHFHVGGTTNAFQFVEGGSAVFAGTLTQNSDYRIKANVTDLAPEQVAERMRAVRTIEYTDTRDSSSRRVGVIAHELEAQFPLLVEGTKDAVNTSQVWEGDLTPYEPGTEPADYVPPVRVKRDEPVLQNVNYIGLIPYLIAAWQASDERISTLQKQVEALLSK
jgi:hypothetical protein